MKFIDFFAGIGGFRKGMELAGHECVGFCEFDKFATASYISMHLLTDEQRKTLGDIPIKKRQKEILKEEYRNGEWYANDIRRVYARDIPKADCWCFGFPCQDISVAGKQAGFQGNRSSLFFRVMYLVGQLKEEDKPTYLFSLRTLKICLVLMEDGISPDCSLKWSREGMMQNGRCSTPKISECHKTGKDVLLSDILEEEVPQKYFLSKEQTKKIVFR
jgi:DNA (cytosine-5)-methyltransferase 1